MTSIMIYVTCPDKECAETISRALISKRLVACANVFKEHQSYYWWEGEVQNDSEFAVLFKTKAILFEPVEKEIKSLHPYDVPCIVSWDIEKGHAPFMAWITEETQ